jgi:hypothetical protein
MTTTGYETYLDPAWAQTMLKEREGDKGRYRISSSESNLNWASLPEEGSVTVRIIPKGYGEKRIGLLIFKHYNIPEINSVPCFSSYNMDCPVCNVVLQYQNMIDIKNWVKIGRTYFNVLFRDSKEFDSKIPYILRCSDYNFFWMLEKLMDPQFGNIVDINNGHDILFKRKTRKGPLDRTIVLKSSPLLEDPEEGAKILEACTDLTTIWRAPDEKYQKLVTDTAITLERTIKERLQALKGGVLTSPSSAVENVITTSNAMPGRLFMKPAHAPECFGMSYKESAEKCIICTWGFSCGKIFAGANAT